MGGGINPRFLIEIRAPVEAKLDQRLCASLHIEISFLQFFAHPCFDVFVDQWD